MSSAGIELAAELKRMRVKMIFIGAPLARVAILVMTRKMAIRAMAL